MENTWYEEEYKGFKIKVYQDEDAEDPRKGWDNLGTMVCFHPSYDLGDKNDLSLEELLEIVGRKDVVALPLVLLDHSGLWMKVGDSFDCDHGGWDTSKVGFIYATYEDIRKAYGRKHITMSLRLKAENDLRQEVEVYSAFLEGNVVGWVVEDLDGEHIESCWGYYGREEVKRAIQEAKECVDGRVTEELWKKNVIGEQMNLFKEVGR